MKKLFNFKTFALIIAAALLLSLASCSAAPEFGDMLNKDEAAMDGMIGGEIPPGNGAQSGNDVSIPNWDEEIAPGEENIGENEDETTSSSPTFVENPFVNTSENNIPSGGRTFPRSYWCWDRGDHSRPGTRSGPRWRISQRV